MTREERSVSLSLRVIKLHSLGEISAQVSGPISATIKLLNNATRWVGCVTCESGICSRLMVANVNRVDYEVVVDADFLLLTLTSSTINCLNCFRSQIGA
jgi:hypothetical protein